MNLPEQFVGRMSEILGGEFDSFMKTYDENFYTGLRANTLKVSPSDLKGILKTELEPVKWCGDGFYYKGDFRAGKSPYYHAGLYYVQEPSAMSPASVIDVSPGHRVLDLCAAPGGKSTQLAAKLKGSGVLISNDVSATRLKALLKNVEVAGVTNSVVTNEPPERLCKRFENYFDRILVDAPCSGEGMFRKDSDAVKSWEVHKSKMCQGLQRGILASAATLLKPGGKMMYSTCTFTPDENEFMIEKFLSKNSDFELIEINHEEFGFEKGLYGFSQCARLWPHNQHGEGHFLAYLHKKGDWQSAQENSFTLKIKGMELFNEFCERYLNFSPNGIFELHGQSLFLMPPGLPSLSGIRLMRSGFYLGDILNKRFEPSQAFAMGIKAEDVRLRINFSADDMDLYRYLKGESFPVGGEDGWSLVTIDNFPLGWAKVLDGRLKNKYLKSWLMN